MSRSNIIRWSTQFKFTTKSKTRNIIKIFPGPTQYAKNRICIPLYAFLEIFDKTIFNNIIKYANKYLEHKNDYTI